MFGVEKIAILRCGQREFASAVEARLGKGRVHAGLLYGEFFRRGEMVGRGPAFTNAGKLVEEIRALTDGTLPEVCGEKVEGETAKFLLKIGELEVESVVIPMGAGQTLCVSSQVGCQMGCAFCETGKMGLLKNLSVEEIVAQVFVARHVMGADVRNIVFMGMGEPLDNYENVMGAVRVLTDQAGLGFGASNITISTSGKVEEMLRLSKEAQASLRLAVSVNAPTDEVRNRLMPVNRTDDMAALKGAMEVWCARSRRTVFVEYVMIAGVNDSVEQAGELATYLEGLRVRINLIPYNAQSRDRFSRSSEEQVEAFATRLRERGYRVLVRQHKGRSIMAACGQLGNLSLRKQLRANRMTFSTRS